MFGVKNKHDSFRRDFEKSIEIESLQIERPFQSTSTRYRHYHDSVICGCLGVGLVATLAESQPSNNQADWCMPSEILTTTIFSYDLLYRLSLRGKRGTMYWRFLIADVIALLPLPMHLIAGESFPVLYAFKMLRLLKSCRHYREFPVLIEAGRESVAPLIATLYFLFLTGFLASALLYTLEVESDNKIKSIPDSVWFTVVTMSTVGYGDIIPLTPFGQFCCCCLILLGLLFIALPISIVGNNFIQAWHDKDKIVLANKLQSCFGSRIDDVFLKAAFDSVDVDRDGKIDITEFANWLVSHNMLLTRADLWGLWEAIDRDASGEISNSEFNRFMLTYGHDSSQRNKLLTSGHAHAIHNLTYRASTAKDRKEEAEKIASRASSKESAGSVHGRELGPDLHTPNAREHLEELIATQKLQLQQLMSMQALLPREAKQVMPKSARKSSRASARASKTDTPKKPKKGKRGILQQLEIGAPADAIKVKHVKSTGFTSSNMPEDLSTSATAVAPPLLNGTMRPAENGCSLDTPDPLELGKEVTQPVNFINTMSPRHPSSDYNQLQLDA